MNRAVRLNLHLRFFRRELLRELFSPRNRKKWVHNPLLNFSNRRCEYTHIVQCHPLLNVKVKVHAIVEKITGMNGPLRY